MGARFDVLTSHGRIAEVARHLVYNHRSLTRYSTVNLPLHVRYMSVTPDGGVGWLLEAAGVKRST